MPGYTARWVRTIVQRWNRAGEQGIADHRQTLPGAPCLLSIEQQKKLDQALDLPPADGGLWNGPKVAAWMAEHLGRPVDPRRGQAFSLALSAFAQEQEVGPNKRLLLVMDQAGWHKSRDLVIPEGRHLLFWPSHSPELQPAERLWPLTNEPLANRVFRSLDELEQVQAERCRWLQAHPESIRGRTSFHWWPSLDTT